MWNICRKAIQNLRKISPKACRRGEEYQYKTIVVKCTDRGKSDDRREEFPRIVKKIEPRPTLKRPGL